MTIELKPALDDVYQMLRDQDTMGAALALERVLKVIDNLAAAPAQPSLTAESFSYTQQQIADAWKACGLDRQFSATFKDFAQALVFDNSQAASASRPQAQQLIEIGPTALAASAPAAKPAKRDPLREAAILAVGALERIQHDTESERMEAADALRQALQDTASRLQAQVVEPADLSSILACEIECSVYEKHVAPVLERLGLAGITVTLAPTCFADWLLAQPEPRAEALRKAGKWDLADAAFAAGQSARTQGGA